MGGLDWAGRVPVLSSSAADAETRTSVLFLLARSINLFFDEHGLPLGVSEPTWFAAELMEGRPEPIWRAMKKSCSSMIYTNLDLGDLWEVLCREPTAHSDPRIPTAVVSAFVRSGMPLGSPLPSDRDALSSYSGRARWCAPLHTAVKRNADLAHALLDLPRECGLDVNIGAMGGGSVHIAPAIGYTNRNECTTEQLFERLLRRTARSVVNSGAVYVDRGCEQHTDPSTHVLISNILILNHIYYKTPPRVNLVDVFIAYADADGGGADLTGGVATDSAPYRPEVEQSVEAKMLWENRQFRGALVLVDTICQCHCRLGNPDSITLFSRFSALRTVLIQALLRIRTYRRKLFPTLAHPMDAASIHLRDMHLLIAAYILVPLHDESQLQHPLLDFPPPETTSCCRIL
jgi:hypothetical protein